MSVLRMILDFAVFHRQESGLCINPAVGVKKSKGLPSTKRPALTEAQEKVVWQSSIDQTAPGWLFGFALMCLGTRRGELLALTHQDIDWKRNVVRIDKEVNYSARNTPVLETFLKSDNGNREIPLLPELAAVLPRNHIGLVFPSPSTGSYMKASELNTMWKRYCRAMGFMKEKDGKMVHAVTPHCFRHTFATICFEADVDARTAAAWMGDSVAVMEAVYVELRKTHAVDGENRLREHIAAKDALQVCAT